jgi:hypothetical protein
MASYFRTKVAKDIGTVAENVLATISNNRFTVIGCNLANTTTDAVSIDITVIDANLIEAYYIKQLIIPAHTSAKVITNGEKLILAENCTLRIVADTIDSIDAVISYAEII